MKSQPKSLAAFERQLRAKSARPRASEDDLKKVREALERGATLPEVAHLLELSVSTVARLIGGLSVTGGSVAVLSMHVGRLDRLRGRGAA